MWGSISCAFPTAATSCCNFSRIFKMCPSCSISWTGLLFYCCWLVFLCKKILRVKVRQSGRLTPGCTLQARQAERVTYVAISSMNNTIIIIIHHCCCQYHCSHWQEAGLGLRSVFPVQIVGWNRVGGQGWGSRWQHCCHWLSSAAVWLLASLSSGMTLRGSSGWGRCVPNGG